MFDPFSIIAYNHEGWGLGGNRLEQVRYALLIREVKDEVERQEKLPGCGRANVYEIIYLDNGSFHEGKVGYLLDSPKNCIRLVRQLMREECLTHPLKEVRQAAGKAK